MPFVKKKKSLSVPELYFKGSSSCGTFPLLHQPAFGALRHRLTSRGQKLARYGSGLSLLMPCQNHSAVFPVYRRVSGSPVSDMLKLF